MPLPHVAACVAVVLAAFGCASSEDLAQSYQRGIKAARAGHWKTAMEDLGAFVGQSCKPPRPDPRCREAYLALSRGYERRGAAARAWVAMDAALTLPPHARDEAVRVELARLQIEVQDKLQDTGDHGPVMIRYRDEVTDEFAPRSVVVLVDFTPVYTKDKDASELRGPDFAKVYGGSLPPGEHVLVVEAAHGCRPGAAERCKGSQAHRAFIFQSQSRTPVGLDVRAFAQPAEGDEPARPALDLNVQ